MCTADGILLKVDGTAQHEGKTTPVRIALANIHVRAQDAALFDVPGTMKVVPYAMAQMLLKRDEKHGAAYAAKWAIISKDAKILLIFAVIIYIKKRLNRFFSSGHHGTRGGLSHIWRDVDA